MFFMVKWKEWGIIIVMGNDAKVGKPNFKKKIYQYGNYREFLADFYANSKKNDKKFTIVIFSWRIYSRIC